MASEIIPFVPGQMPDHVKKFLDAGNSNIVERQTVNSLNYGGKQFSVTIGGKKTNMMKRGDSGELEPISILPIIILGYNPRRGRSFYIKGYDETKPTAPDCFSDDGVAPSSSSKLKQSDKCKGCPQSIKGSKVSADGTQAAVACSEHRMLAVVPAKKMDMPPLRLRIAITSDWDTRSPQEEAQGWYSFSKFTDFLTNIGVSHTAAVVTLVKMDPNSKFAKLFFKVQGYIGDQETLDFLAKLAKSDPVNELLNGTYGPNSDSGETKEGGGEPVGATKPDAPKSGLGGAATEPDNTAAKAAVAAAAAQQAAKAAAQQAAKIAAAKAAETAKLAAEEAARLAAAAEAEANAGDGEMVLDGDVILPGDDEPKAEAAKPTQAEDTAKVAAAAAAKAAKPKADKPGAAAAATAPPSSNVQDLLQDWG